MENKVKVLYKTRMYVEILSERPLDSVNLNFEDIAKGLHEDYEVTDLIGTSIEYTGVDAVILARKFADLETYQMDENGYEKHTS